MCSGCSPPSPSQAVVIVLMGVIAIASGIVALNRWMAAHHIAPALLVAVTAFVRGSPGKVMTR